MKTWNEPTREQLKDEAVLNAQKIKWDGWNWKSYQSAIVRLNWRISELEAQNARLFSQRGKPLIEVLTGKET